MIALGVLLLVAALAWCWGFEEGKRKGCVIEFDLGEAMEKRGITVVDSYKYSVLCRRNVELVRELARREVEEDH